MDNSLETSENTANSLPDSDSQPGTQQIEQAPQIDANRAEMPSEQIERNQDWRDTRENPNKGSPEPIPGKCGSKLKHTAGVTRYCTCDPMNDATRCYYHGGSSLSGPMHPAFKNGLYAKRLKFGLLDKVIEASNDPNFLSVRHEAEVLQARAMTLLEQIDTPEGEILWSKLEECWLQLQLLRENPEAFQETMQEAGRIIREGSSQRDKWREFRDLVKEIKDLKSHEHTRLVETGYLVQADEALGVVKALLEIMRANVKDRVALRNIHKGAELLLLRGGMKKAIQPPAMEESIPSIPSITTQVQPDSQVVATDMAAANQIAPVE